MVVLTKNPDGNDAVTLTPTSTNWQDVSDVSDLTFVANDTVNGNLDDLYTLDGIVPAGSINISVKDYIRCVKLVGGVSKTCRAYTRIKENGVTTVGAVNTLSTVLTWYSSTYANRPSDGLAWTVADANALKAGVRLYNVDVVNSIAQCMKEYVEVSYTAPSGGLRRLLLHVGL